MTTLPILLYVDSKVLREFNQTCDKIGKDKVTVLNDFILKFNQTILHDLKLDKTE